MSVKLFIIGADSGIGASVAIAFAREGADISMNYLPSEEKDAQKIINLLKKKVTKLLFY